MLLSGKLQIIFLATFHILKCEYLNEVCENQIISSVSQIDTNGTYNIEDKITLSCKMGYEMYYFPEYNKSELWKNRRHRCKRNHVFSEIINCTHTGNVVVLEKIENVDICEVIIFESEQNKCREPDFQPNCEVAIYCRDGKLYADYYSMPGYKINAEPLIQFSHNCNNSPWCVGITALITLIVLIIFIFLAIRVRKENKIHDARLKDSRNFEPIVRKRISPSTDFNEYSSVYEEPPFQSEIYDEIRIYENVSMLTSVTNRSNPAVDDDGYLIVLR